MPENLKLLQPTLQEIECLTSGNTNFNYSGHQYDIKEILPKIVIQTTLKRHQNKEDWFWCAPRFFYHCSKNIIVGSGIFIKSLSPCKVELGYGVLKQYEGNGFATDGVACLLKEAFTRAEIEVVAVQTAIGNIASERVLEKNGFSRNGQNTDADDGLLNLWKYTPQKSNIK